MLSGEGRKNKLPLVTSLSSAVLGSGLTQEDFVYISKYYKYPPHVHFCKWRGSPLALHPEKKLGF